MQTPDLTVVAPDSAAASSQSIMARSVSAMTNVLVSPKTAFEEIRAGIHLWVPLLLLAAYRTCWLFVAYPAGRRPDRVLLNLGVQTLLVTVEYAVLALPLVTLLWIQGGQFAVRTMFALLLTAAAVSELGALVAALVGRAFLGLDANPAGQVLTNLGWMVSVDQHRALQHVLSRIDVFELWAVALVAWGASRLVQGLSRKQVWWTTVVVWGSLVAGTTFIKWYVS